MRPLIKITKIVQYLSFISDDVFPEWGSISLLKNVMQGK
jgi:hypothetical protein